MSYDPAEITDRERFDPHAKTARDKAREAQREADEESRLAFNDVQRAFRTLEAIAEGKEGATPDLARRYLLRALNLMMRAGWHTS